MIALVKMKKNSYRKVDKKEREIQDNFEEEKKEY